MDTDYPILLLPRKNWKIVSNLKEKQTVNDRGQKIELIVLLVVHSEFFFSEYAATSTKKRTRGNLLKKNSDVQRCYASVARRTSVMMLPRKIENSVAKVRIRVFYNRAAMVPWKKTEAFSMKHLLKRQQTEFSAQTIILLLHMNN